MKNSNRYISPYGNKRKKNSGALTSFLLEFVMAGFMAALILCIVALSA